MCGWRGMHQHLITGFWSPQRVSLSQFFCASLPLTCAPPHAPLHRLVSSRKHLKYYQALILSDGSLFHYTLYLNMSIRSWQSFSTFMSCCISEKSSSHQKCQNEKGGFVCKLIFNFFSTSRLRTKGPNYAKERLKDILGG